MDIFYIDEDITPEGFTRFLVKSPLKPRPKQVIQPTQTVSSSISVTNNVTVNNNKRTFPFGTYHQKHYIDDKLVAVGKWLSHSRIMDAVKSDLLNLFYCCDLGVLDIVPTGVSSVYCFYDPDFRELVLGKICAVKEIEFTVAQGLEYYYLGYYIGTCQKMKYKSDYQPCELLCPTTLVYYPFEQVLPLLRQYRFTPFNLELYEKRALLAPPDFDSNGEAPVNPALAQFAPSYTPNIPCKTDNILLQISPNQIVTLSALTKAGRNQVLPWLLEWQVVCGPSIDCSKVKFLFHD